MKNKILLVIILFSVLVLNSCERKIKNAPLAVKDNSELQAKLLNDTKKFNALAKKDSSNLKYNSRFQLNFICKLGLVLRFPIWTQSPKTSASIL